MGRLLNTAKTGSGPVLTNLGFIAAFHVLPVVILMLTLCAASARAQVITSADLGLTKSDWGKTADPVNAGAAFSYTLSVPAGHP
jgi:hypothetical protein